MPDSEAKKKWMKENFWLISIRFHRNYDADLIAFLESVGDEKQKIMKAALREYIQNHQKTID